MTPPGWQNEREPRLWGKSWPPSNGDDDRRVREDVLFIQHRTVDHASFIWPRLLAIASVDVAEDMELGLNPQDCLNQILAAEAGAENMPLVECAVGRPMGDDNIRARRDAVPVPAARHAALDVEGPVGQHRRVWRSPEADPSQNSPAVLEVHRMGQ